MNNKNALQLAEYTLESGQVLTADTVRRYINKDANEQEILMFIELCKAQRLNPFIRDAYLVKYGDQAAQIIVGKDVFIKRADANPNFNGMKAGIVVIDKNGNMVEREGALKVKGEELVGGWCEVYLKNKQYPVRALVGFDEYAQKNKKTGQLNSMWSTKGATMIRKVAQSQALREAFPNELRGLYQEEEMGIDNELPQKPINPGGATKEQKTMIMALAAQKDLFSFDTMKDTSRLESWCNSNGYDLKHLKFGEVEELLETLAKYEPKKIEVVEDIQDVEFTEVKEATVDNVEGQVSLI